MVLLNMYSLGATQQQFIHYFLFVVVLLPNSNDTCVWVIYIVLYLLIQSRYISNTVRGYTILLRSNIITIYMFRRVAHIYSAISIWTK